MEPKTLQEQVKATYVVPDKMFGAFFMQGFYDRVYKLNSSQVVVQGYSDLPQVLNDYQDGMLALQFLDITDYGPDNEWILNKNIEDSEQSITERIANKFIINTRKMLKVDAQKMHLGIFFVAGHGMIHEGS